MINTEVCLSPELIHLHELKEKTVVVVDILRATSCMTAGIATGVASIMPFAEQQACLHMKEQGYITAGERNGQKIPGFDMGNSPFEFMESACQDRHIAMTTTNGTQAIERSKAASHILIGSFLNLTAVTRAVVSLNREVVIHCAAWKGKVNIEDTLFAGAMLDLFPDRLHPADDAGLAAKELYRAVKTHLHSFISQASHVNRLKKLNIEKDIEYCLTPDVFDVVPFVDKQAWCIRAFKED